MQKSYVRLERGENHYRMRKQTKWHGDLQVLWHGEHQQSMFPRSTLFSKTVAMKQNLAKLLIWKYFTLDNEYFFHWKNHLYSIAELGVINQQILYDPIWIPTRTLAWTCIINYSFVVSLKPFTGYLYIFYILSNCNLQTCDIFKIWNFFTIWFCTIRELIAVLIRHGKDWTHSKSLMKFTHPLSPGYRLHCTVKPKVVRPRMGWIIHIFIQI